MQAGDNFVTPSEFSAFLQVTYKVFQHRRDKPDTKAADVVATSKTKDDEAAALRDAAKQSRKVSHTLSQFTTPLQMAAYLFQPRERREKSKATIADSDEEMEPVIIPDNPGAIPPGLYPCACLTGKLFLPYVQHARPAE